MSTSREIQMLVEQTTPMLTSLSYDWSREINRLLATIVRQQIIRLLWVKYNPQLLLTYNPTD